MSKEKGRAVPKFAYNAVDANGKEVNGIIEAEDENEALSEIGRMNLFVTSIHTPHVHEELREKLKEERELRKKMQERKTVLRRAKRPRQRLVVRYANGKTRYGVCFALNPNADAFHLDCTDVNAVPTGETIKVPFSSLKAVFQVKSFDGNFDPTVKYPEQFELGEEVIVEFKDGEIIRGYSAAATSPSSPRFFIVPTEKDTNNINILVERSAVKRVWSVEEYEKEQERIKAQARDTVVKRKLTQEESTGDFYFQTRNYEAALQEYKEALKKDPHSATLRKKIFITEYNIGVHYISQREYEKALEIMERVLKKDPKNERVLRKVTKLRKAIERKREKKKPT